MSGELRVEGLKEFRQALRRAEDATPRVLSKELKSGVTKVAERAQRYGKGRFGSAVKPFARGTTAGIRSNLPGAKVHEFVPAGGTFQRQGRSGASHTVRWNDPAATPRYAYRARDEMADDIGEDILAAVKRAASNMGWL